VSAGLIGYNGGLLLVNGSLTNDLNCCCDIPPPDCPACCIKIDWGDFNADGDLYAQYDVDGITIDVRVIMPTKNSRVICDEEQISVEWDVDDTPSDRGSYIRFGAAWAFNGETPSVGVDGEVYEWGLVDWVGSVASDYTASLTLRSCFLDTGDFHGFIVIGTDFPEWELDIEASRCVTTDRCCDIEPECEDCCALVEIEDYAVSDGKHYIITNNTDADGNIFTGVLEISFTTPGKVCRGESVGLHLYLVPPRHTEIENNTILTVLTPWIVDSFTPAINPLDGLVTPIEIDWGTLTAYEYTAIVTIDCEDVACPPPLDFPIITMINTVFGFSATIDFEECDVEGCCEPVCCCEKIAGYDIEITGIVDIAGLDCDCSALNISIHVPKTSHVGNSCSGVVDDVEGVVCIAGTSFQSFSWTLTCMEDGTHVLNVEATGVTQGESDLIRFDQTFEACTPCDEMGGTQACVDCDPAPDPPQGNFCDYSGATITVTPVMEP